MSENTLVSSAKKRYLEIDLIKFAAIIFMPFVHTYEYNAYEAFFESPGYNNPILYALNYIIEFFAGAPGAPVFMLCMGLGITFSENVTPKKLLKRSGQLALVGVLVNFFEEILPLVWDKPGIGEILDSWPGLFANDVYFFFAITFLFFAFAFAVKAPVILSSIACILCLVGGFFLPYMDFCSDSTVANLLLGLFFRTDEYSFFPFTSWIIFPTAGYLFGRILTKTEDKAKLYYRLAAIGAVVLVITTVIGLCLGYENCMLNALDCEDADFYTPNFFSQLWALAFIPLWLVLAYLVTKNMKDGKVKSFIVWGSRSVKQFYVIQWLVIALLAPVICLSENIFFAYAAGLTVAILSFLLTKAYLSLKAKAKAKK